jgi:hypothetical protein
MRGPVPGPPERGHWVGSGGAGPSVAMPDLPNPDPGPIRAKFVILAAPRSGSNMLCTMLGSHPSILCHHEIFNPKGIRLALQLRETGFVLGTVEERGQDPEAFLERVWTTRLGFPCVGFKLTHRQDERVFCHVLSDATVAKIVLRRRNRLKTYVSHRISETLGEWEVYRPQDLIRERPRIRVEPRAFLERVAFDEAYYDEIGSTIDARGQAQIEVWYERLFSADVQDSILEFLGLGPAAGGMIIGSVKQNSRHLEDLVENYEELLRVFAGTPFEAELKDHND